MSHIRIVEKKPVFQAKHFEVDEMTLVLPNGKTVIHNDVFRKPSVSIFPITSSYEIYMIYQYRYLYEKTILEAIAGMIDANEDPLEAAKRELKEETGIRSKVWTQMNKIYMAGSMIKAVNYQFIATDLSFGKSNLEETEEIELVKLSLDEAVKKIVNGEIMTSSTIIGILMLEKMRREEMA